VVGAKFLPLYGPVPSEYTTVPADVISIGPGNKSMSVDQGKTVPIIEIMVQFTLTKQQYGEEHLNTAVTLATRAANLLAQAQDLVFFQGKGAATDVFFRNNPVVVSGGALPTNLVGLLSPPPSNQIQVPPKENRNGAD